MAPNFWRIVKNVTSQADVVLLLVDARMVEESRNADIERMVRDTGKPLIYVVTKCDLVKKKDAELWKKRLTPCVFVSSTEYYGLSVLKERIWIEATRAGVRDRKVYVGVLGYPNVGKSSLVNAMTGRGSAQTSTSSGHTRSKKFVTSSSNIVFVDTPGVIPLGEKGMMKHTFMGAVDFSKTKDPDLAVMGLLEKYPGKVEEYYGVKVDEDKEETIKAIAIKCNIFKKGGVPDIARASVKILKDWQTGEIR